MVINKKETLSLLLGITLLAFAIYLPSFSVPFFLDDHSSIVDNHILQTGSAAQVVESSGRRPITYLSFWLDIQFNNNIKQHHYTNWLIHLLSGFFTFLLSAKLLTLTNTNLTAKQIHYIATAAALLFIVHPLQTQAVTYIIQRSASLAALCYLASIYFYFCFREAITWLTKCCYFISCILATICALYSKENAYSIFVIFVLTEWAIFKSIKTRQALVAIISLSISILLLYCFSEGFAKAVGTLDKLTREDPTTTRFDYLQSQLNIIWLYVYKFIVPLNLRLEYGFSTNSFSKTQILLAAAAHVTILAFAVLIVKQKRLLTFLILFFYTAHSIESSIIPIKDLAFEHRAYLPNFSLCLLASLLAFNLLTYTKYKKTVSWLFVFIVGILSLLTYERNSLWQQPKIFYQNELTYSPNNCRVLGNLSYEYMKEKNNQEAIKYLERCLHNRDNQSLNPQLIINYVSLLTQSSQLIKAEKIALQWLPKVSDNTLVKVDLLESLADIELRKNNLPRSESYLRQSIELAPGKARSLISLSLVLAKQGKIKQARKAVTEGLKIEPNNQLGTVIAKRLGM